MPPKLTNDTLLAAIAGLESQKQILERQISELRGLLDGVEDSKSEPATQSSGRRGRRKFSAEARRRMREAQLRRWQKIRGGSEPAAAPKAPQRKRRMSREGRERIAAATRARWARMREQKGQAANKPAAKRQSAAKKTAAQKTQAAG